MCSFGSISKCAPTLHRSPISKKSCRNVIPEIPFFRELVTVSRSFPKQEVIPKPVITALFLDFPLLYAERLRAYLEVVGALEETNFEIFCRIDLAPVDVYCPVCDAHNQFSLDQTV